VVGELRPPGQLVKKRRPKTVGTFVGTLSETTHNLVTLRDGT